MRFCEVGRNPGLTGGADDQNAAEGQGNDCGVWSLSGISRVPQQADAAVVRLLHWVWGSPMLFSSQADTQKGGAIPIYAVRENRYAVRGSE